MSTRGELRRRSFTLVELLVVVAIVALLISILLPAMGQARKQGRATACLSNMRGMGMAVLMYCNDNRDFLVTVGLSHEEDHYEPEEAWIRTLSAYYNNKLLARCPSDRSPHWSLPVDGGPEVPMPVEDPNDPLYAKLRHVSYGMNGYTHFGIGPPDDERGPYNRLGMFRRPATTVYIVEMAEEGEFAMADHVHPDEWGDDPETFAAEQVELERHRGKANYNFIDGHAAPHTFEDTYEIDQEASEFPNVVWAHNMYDPDVAW